MVHVFLDTEFTSLENGKLISAALVSEDGKALYFERSEGWGPEDCSEFVVEAVLPLIGPPEDRMTDAQIRRAIKDFVASLGEAATVYTDSAMHDEPMFKSLFADHMNEWPPKMDQRFMWCSSRGVEEVHARQKLQRHHAQDDALALMVAFRENCAGWGC